MRSDLAKVVETLAARHPAGAVLTDPLALIVWENVGYLVDDGRREALFAEFRDRIGLDAAAIVNAPPAVLLDIAERGGMNPPERARRLKAIGERIVELGGDLGSVITALPTTKARALLKGFPAVGDPLADKIMLFGGYEVRPALDSNGLRSLVRLGFCTERASYSTTYRDAVTVMREHGRMERDWLVGAWAALREHGKILCRRKAPLCADCPLERECPKTEIRAL
ncbi:MAG: hypothetical protein JSR45_05825 [Proteobacteria bacterium]|nr:hypothetical protein [Pseudomonadota bacterium]